MEEDKIFKYRGKTSDELKGLSREDFMKLLPSSQRRKMKRGFTEQENKLLKKFKENQKNIKTHCRDMIILPEMFGSKISVYNGREFVQVTLLPEYVGLRLGELAPTRKIATHSGAGAKKTDVRK